MELREHTTSRVFWRAAERFLSKDPANNTVTLSNIDHLIKGKTQGIARFFSVHDARGRVVGTALMSSIRVLVISAMPELGYSLIAELLNKNRDEMIELVGPTDGVRKVLKHIAHPSRTVVRLLLYRLDAPPIYGSAKGCLRLARISDSKLMAEWFLAFDKEAGIPPRPGIHLDFVQDRIRRKIHFVWEVDGEIICMAGGAALPCSSARIGPVYTPPAHRGRGYAQAAVAAVSAKMQRMRPAHSVFLFTDANYPASNVCYQRVGFVHVSNHWHVRL